MIFDGLSDSLDTKELESYFEKFFEMYENKPKNMPALKELYELAYRQWDTYEPVSSCIAEKAEIYLMSAIQINSYDIMDIILSITENLSLKDIFSYIISKKEDIRNPSVKVLIEEAENDYSDTIGNPFDCIAE